MEQPAAIKKPINNQPLVASPYLICDNCGAYPLLPMHGHYLCLKCRLPTKCCEGGPIEL